MFLLYFILSVFPADATENRRHIHVVRRGSKKSHRGDTVAKVWIEENGQKKIEIAWSELTSSEVHSVSSNSEIGITYGGGSSTAARVKTNTVDWDDDWSE